MLKFQIDQISRLACSLPTIFCVQGTQLLHTRRCPAKTAWPIDLKFSTQLNLHCVQLVSKFHSDRMLRFGDVALRKSDFLRTGYTTTAYSTLSSQNDFADQSEIFNVTKSCLCSICVKFL